MKALLFIMLLAPNLVRAQECQYSKNGVDEFEKVKVIVTKEERVMAPNWSFPVLFLSLGRVDTSYSVILRFSYNSNICLSSESELLILCENDRVFRLKSGIKFVDCTKRNTKTSATFFEGIFPFEISESDIISLQQSKIKKIRLYASDSGFEADLTKGNRVKDSGTTYFIRNARCILDK